MGFLDKAMKYAKSEQGKKALAQAQKFANDPKTKEKLDDAKEKIEDFAERLTKKGEKPDAEKAPAAAPPATPPAVPPTPSSDR